MFFVLVLNIMPQFHVPMADSMFAKKLKQFGKAAGS
jgi:hypothetical protein